MKIHLILAGDLDNPQKTADLKNLNIRTIKKTIRRMDPSLDNENLAKNLAGEQTPDWVQEWAKNNNVTVKSFAFGWDDCFFIITE